MNKKNFEGLKKSAVQAGQILNGELEPIRVFKVKVPQMPTKKKDGFALCVKSTEPDSLIPFKLYRAKFSSNNYVGITDENGEAVIYPAEYFMKLDFPSEAETVLGDLQKAA